MHQVQLLRLTWCNTTPTFNTKVTAFNGDISILVIYVGNRRKYYKYISMKKIQILSLYTQCNAIKYVVSALVCFISRSENLSLY